MSIDLRFKILWRIPREECFNSPVETKHRLLDRFEKQDLRFKSYF